MNPVTPLSPLFRLFSGLFPVHSLARLLCASLNAPHVMPLNAATHKAWLRWKRAFLTQPSIMALGNPALATGLTGFAYLMRDHAVLATLKKVLSGPSDPHWHSVQAAIHKPRAWILVAGPQANQWKNALKPVLDALSEPINLYIQAEEVPGLPENWPLAWHNTTRAVLCRGLECSSPVSDLDYLVDTLQDA